jgi:hypothetical protein
VSDRLELALFTLHHRVLAQAAADVGSRIEAEELADAANPQGARKSNKVQSISRTGT